MKSRMVLVLLVASVSGAPGQEPQVMGTGYVAPVPLRAAPGQVITLFVADGGAKDVTWMASPPGTVVTALGGYTVTYSQPQVVRLPIFRIHPISPCLLPASDLACGQILSISVQMPMEMEVPIGLVPLPSVIPNFVVVHRQGVAGTPILVQPDTDRIRIQGPCDLLTLTRPYIPFSNCAAQVRHPDQALVSAASPAQAGEVLVLYAYGLGTVEPPVATGAVTPEPAPTTTYPVRIDFTFATAVGTGEMAPGDAPTSGTLDPLFAGLSPGSIGLYQVNFRVPPVPRNVIPCGYGQSSNVTMTLRGRASSDTFSFCVEPPGGGIP